VVGVGLIVGLSLRIRVVEYPNGTQLISDYYDGLAKHFLYLHDLVVVIVLVLDAFQARV
jgi:hypothetical protein